MTPRFLLDTHVVVRWWAEPRKLSREQSRVLREAVHRSRPVAVSAISLLEIAALLSSGRLPIRGRAGDFLTELGESPACEILPITVEIASEVSTLGNVLRDPADRAIVATARVHGLRLLTSDQRIIESKLAQTIE